MPHLQFRSSRSKVAASDSLLAHKWLVARDTNRYSVNADAVDKLVNFSDSSISLPYQFINGNGRVDSAAQWGIHGLTFSTSKALKIAKYLETADMKKDADTHDAMIISIFKDAVAIEQEIVSAYNNLSLEDEELEDQDVDSILDRVDLVIGQIRKQTRDLLLKGYIGREMSTKRRARHQDNVERFSNMGEGDKSPDAVLRLIVETVATIIHERRPDVKARAQAKGVKPSLF